MRHLTTFISLLIFTVVTGQTKYEPQILILAPNQTTCEKTLDKEVSDYNKKLKQSQATLDKSKALDSPEFKNQPENIQAMAKCDVEFSKNLDFYKQASSICEQFLAYRLFEKFPNLLIKLIDKKSDGTLTNLKAFSESEKLQYVLNFSSIDLYKEKRKSHARINVQLYDNKTNSFLLDKSFIGDWNNPGLEFCCTDKTIQCTLNNSLSQALDEVIYIIATNSPTIIREKELQKERGDILANKYYDLAFDKKSLKDIISPLDSTINVDMAYQALFNIDKTKFVAFFIQQVSSQNLKSLTESKKDNNVQIISGKDIKDKGFLDEIPKTYSYIVSGVKYENKWYYKKSAVTYFEAHNLNEGKQVYYNKLQSWNFFKDNSTEFNPEFWETELFKKVPDLTKDPKWDKYGKSIWQTDEINNRDYIGMYEIVAESLRDKIQIENNVFKTKTKQQFSTLYEKLKKEYPETYIEIDEHSLIFPTNKSVVINPAVIKSSKGVRTIHYFVLVSDKNEFYEWTYFNPKVVKEIFFGDEVVDQIGSLTNWNFSVDNLNDKKFWAESVLLKINDTYKYLKEIK
jgi:hypothetical protein